MLKSFGMQRHSFISLGGKCLLHMHKKVNTAGDRQLVHLMFLHPKDCMHWVHTPEVAPWLVVIVVSLIHDLAARRRPVGTSPVGWEVLVPSCAY